MTFLSESKHPGKVTPMRILMIGPLPPPIGGTRVSFKMLVDALKCYPDVELRIIDLPPVRSNKIKALWHFISQIIKLLINTPKSDVVALHCGLSSIYVRATVVSFIAKLFRKPLIIRNFGGGTIYDKSKLSGLNPILRVLKKADLYLAQTKEQIQQANSAGLKAVEWFPTNREVPDSINNSDKKQCRRFVFISHVRKSKGIEEIIHAGERFNDDITIDVYGPFRDGMTKDVFKHCQNVRYRGVIDSDKVVDVLKSYDVLLFPTHHQNEGYPGIIIEAYAAGLPVICTRWRVAHEIVDETSGIMIESKNANALYEAIKKLSDSPDLYAELRKGALEKRTIFDFNTWTKRFVGFCQNLLSNR